MAALLAGAFYAYAGQGSALATAKADQAVAADQVAEAVALAASQTKAGNGTVAPASASAVLAYAKGSDVDWTAVASQLDAISEPLGVSFASVVGTARVVPAASAAPVTVATTVASGAAAAATTVAPVAVTVVVGNLGSLAVSGHAADLNAVAAWIDAVVADERFDAAWVDSTKTASDGTGLEISATVTLNAIDVVARTGLQAVTP